MKCFKLNESMYTINYTHKRNKSITMTQSKRINTFYKNPISFPQRQKSS